MNRLKILLTRILALILVLVCFAACRKTDNADIFSPVDAAIESNSQYQAEKENKIISLRAELLNSTDDYQRMAATDRLIEQYESYMSDSALHYVNLNLENPLVKRDSRHTIRLLIKKADILSHAGLFTSAEQTLESIPRAEIDSTLLAPYFATYASLHQYQSEYSDDTELAEENDKKRELYIDSVILVSEPGSFAYVVNNSSSQIRKGSYDEAIAQLFESINRYEMGQREYSILASLLAFAYQTKGDVENHKRYLALSAESDLKGAVKENMAMRALATVCFEEGNLERANRYLKQSFADANFYAARMRNSQSSRMLPLIDEAYQQRQGELQQRQKIYLITVTALALILLVTIAVLALQIVRVHKANRQKQNTLEELEQLSNKLAKLNDELYHANADLRATNIIKEEYAGLFMEYCSLAIHNLEQYHNQLRTIAMKGNASALLKKLDSTEIENKIWRDFYTKFDEAIIGIYPSFVEKFNALLKPGSEISLRPGEILNTELRLFALIRIGINDPEKIARFLRCSLSTIYTYRSKIKKRTKKPETFEKDLLSI